MLLKRQVMVRVKRPQLRILNKANFKEITICSLNINGLLNKSQLLTDYLNNNNVDIMLLQECKAYNINTFYHPLYNQLYVSPNDASSDGQPIHGNAILIRKSIRYEQFTPFSKPKNIDAELYARFLGINLVDYNTVIINAYLPSVRSSATSTNNNRLDKSLEYLSVICEGHSNIILGGDFNTDCIRDIDSVRMELQTQHLGGIFHDSDLNYVQPDAFTFKSFQNGSERYLDRIIMTLDPSLINHYEIQHNQQIGSDHHPICCKVKLDKQIQQASTITRPTECKLNWKVAKDCHIQAYRRSVMKYIKELPSELSGNSRLEKLVSIIEEAAMKHLPRVKKRKVNSVTSQLYTETVKPALLEFQWWSNRLQLTEKNTQEYRTIDLMRRRSKGRLKWCTRNYNRLKCTQLANHFEGKNIYKSIKKSTNQLLNPPSLLNGKTPTDQLDGWYEHYRKTFNANNKPKLINDTKLFEGDNINIKVTETMEAIKLIDTSKSYKRHFHWQYAPDIAVKELTILFNQWIDSLKTDPAPAKAWTFMSAIIKPILKGGNKPISELKSFRPIASCSSECWLLEKICLARSLEYFDTHETQFGYKSGHSTSHAIAIAKQLNTVDDCYVCLLDASAAFDKISHDRIIEQLKKRNVPANLIRFILGLTFNTNFKICWFNDTTMIPLYPHQGVKQGGVLSAYLFSICYDDLVKRLVGIHAGVSIAGILVKCICYADDILICARSFTGLKLIYAAVIEFTKEYDDIQMNASKSQILRLGTKKLKPMTFDNIPMVNSGRYLGAMLCANKYMDLENSRCRCSLYGRYNSLLRHSKHLRFFNTKSKHNIINTYGLPYGLETLPAVSSSIRQPHRVMTMSLFPAAYSRKDAGGGCTILSRTLYHEIAGCDSLPERHRTLRNKFILKSRLSKNSLIRNIIGTLPLIRGVT